MFTEGMWLASQEQSQAVKDPGLASAVTDMQSKSGYRGNALDSSASLSLQMHYYCFPYPTEITLLILLRAFTI